jgi:hypothetical protein
MWSMMERQERCNLRINFENDRSAVTTITAIGPGQRLEFLAPNRGATIAAFTRGQVQADAVNKLSHARPRAAALGSDGLNVNNALTPTARGEPHMPGLERE